MICFLFVTLHNGLLKISFISVSLSDNDDTTYFTDFPSIKKQNKRSECDKICFLLDNDHQDFTQFFLHMCFPIWKWLHIPSHMFPFIQHYSIKNHEKALLRSQRLPQDFLQERKTILSGVFSSSDNDYRIISQTL